MHDKMSGTALQLIKSVIILLIIQSALAANADGSIGESALYKKLLHNYHANLRPVRRNDEVVTVTIDLGLAQIINMDEKHQVLIWNGWVRQIWEDYRLKWNLSDFSNINDIAIDKQFLWTPDMALYNNAKENFQLLDVEAFERIVVRYDGQCLWMVPFVFKTICKIDVTYFPFDEQICEFEIGSWAYTGAYLNITYKNANGDLSQYSENSAWEVLKMDSSLKVGYYSCCPEPFPSIIFNMHLRRRALYYLYKVIIPSCLIAVLAILSFFLPTSSGERVTLLITNFVSLALFILMLSQMVPPTSDKTPLLEVYLTAVFIEVSAALILRCFIDTAKRQHGRPGYFIRKFVCYYLARLLRVKPLPYSEVVLSSESAPDELELDNIDLYFQVDVVRTIQNGGDITDQVTGPFGMVNNAIDDDASPIHATMNRSSTMEDEIGEATNTKRTEFQSKILKTLESVSDSVRQKWLAKIRKREHDELISSLDKFFFWLFALTISVTVGFVFLTPPTLVL